VQRFQKALDIGTVRYFDIDVQAIRAGKRGAVSPRNRPALVEGRMTRATVCSAGSTATNAGQ